MFSNILLFTILSNISFNSTNIDKCYINNTCDMRMFLDRNHPLVPARLEFVYGEYTHTCRTESKPRIICNNITTCPTNIVCKRSNGKLTNTTKWKCIFENLYITPYFKIISERCSEFDYNCVNVGSFRIELSNPNTDNIYDNEYTSNKYTSNNLITNIGYVILYATLIFVLTELLSSIVTFDLFTPDVLIGLTIGTYITSVLDYNNSYSPYSPTTNDWSWGDNDDE